VAVGPRCGLPDAGSEVQLSRGVCRDSDELFAAGNDLAIGAHIGCGAIDGVATGTTDGGNERGGARDSSGPLGIANLIERRPLPMVTMSSESQMRFPDCGALTSGTVDWLPTQTRRAAGLERHCPFSPSSQAPGPLSMTSPALLEKGLA